MMLAKQWSTWTGHLDWEKLVGMGDGGKVGVLGMAISMLLLRGLFSGTFLSMSFGVALMRVLVTPSWLFQFLVKISEIDSGSIVVARNWEVESRSKSSETRQ